MGAISNSTTARIRQIARWMFRIGQPGHYEASHRLAQESAATIAADTAGHDVVDHERSNPVPKIDIFGLGLHDVVLSGWFNKNTCELAPGFPISADDVVVDVGCGDGGFGKFCAKQGAHVILTDVDAAKIQLAAENLAGSPARKVEARVADANSLPLEDRSASRVICAEVLEHVDDPAAVASELWRVGKPGALYLITVPGALSEHAQVGVASPAYFEKPNHIRIFENGALKNLLESAGLQIESQTSHGFFWTMWWLFAWEIWDTDLPMERQKLAHPLLEAWAATWSELLNTGNGLKIKQVLDTYMPKHQVIVARKPN